MKFILFLFIIAAVYFVSFPMWTEMKAEEACFSEAEQTIDLADFQLKASTLSQEYYCRQTYDTIDVLNVCLGEAQKQLPKNLSGTIISVVNDIEIGLQKRQKSLSSMKTDHDEICREYSGYRFEP